MEAESINNIELLEDIEFRIGIKYEFFMSNVKDGYLDDAKIIFKDLVNAEIDEKIEWLNEYYIREILEDSSFSQRAALWSIADSDANFDIHTIEGTFPVEWTDSIFEEGYYDEVTVIEYLKKHLDPYKISVHSEKDLYEILK